MKQYRQITKKPGDDLTMEDQVTMENDDEDANDDSDSWALGHRQE